ncbi:speckle-type POZ protein-like isoform X1 [Belonocnema kinseyi]|uniref:speckle-type POZ protein-like isoform X1 n=1 Tax=Belonocnema kinseyi TaxID=2817044 RepID=UPI00143D57EC|nr:speckle-type POZ protein-like isoform X1 [Belonocnema kinseyi]
MAQLFDVTQFIKDSYQLPGIDRPYTVPLAVPGVDKTVHSLIIVNNECLQQYKEFSVNIDVQKIPEIKCKFHGYVINNLLEERIDLNFITNGANALKYDVTVYCINSELKFNFFETLHVKDITLNSFYFFTRKIKAIGQNLINGRLFLYCQITRKDILMPLQLEIPKSEMSKQFSTLYENKLLTDFTIICHDQEFLAHKVVLAARSPVFQSMFEHEMKESLENQVEITDFKPEIVEKMLRYIYTDNIEDLNEADAQKLLAIANKYALKRLKIICMKEISKSVNNVSEALEAFSIADQYNVEEFEERVVQFMKDNRHNL